MRHFVPFCLLLCFAGVSCTSSSKSKGQKAHEVGAAKEVAVVQPGNAPAENQPKDGDKKGKAAQPRKIRYTADMRLIVTNFEKAEEGLDAAIKDANADLANSETNSSANTIRSGTWRIRVPVDQFHAFRKAVIKLGEVEKNAVDSEDMTDKYYDLEAHIKNRAAAREAVRDLLKETGKRDMEQYLKVYDKLENINDEINRKEGQLRLWANLTDLTTVTVHLRERQKYEQEPAPNLAEVPTFRMRASTTWSQSWSLVVGLGQSILLFVIALVPWVPIVLLIGLACWLIGPRIFRTKPAPTKSA